MTRYHDLWDVMDQRQIRRKFTASEEAARDAQEAAFAEKRAEVLLYEARQSELRTRLGDDSITSAELRELLRLERGL